MSQQMTNKRPEEKAGGEVDKREERRDVSVGAGESLVVPIGGHGAHCRHQCGQF